MRLGECPPGGAGLSSPSEPREAARDAARGKRVPPACVEQRTIGREREVWTAERQLEALGFGEFWRRLRGKRCPQGGCGHRTLLDDEPVAGDRVCLVGKCLPGCRRSACLELGFELLGRQRVESLPLPLERLKTEPQEAADGRHDCPEVQQDGTSVQARESVAHGAVAQRTTESRFQISRIVTAARRSSGPPVRQVRGQAYSPSHKARRNDTSGPTSMPSTVRRRVSRATHT